MPIVYRPSPRMQAEAEARKQRPRKGAPRGVSTTGGGHSGSLIAFAEGSKNTPEFQGFGSG